MNTLAGKSITWKFANGSMPGITFEHTFADDGSVTWKILDGEHKGASRREDRYAAVRVNDKTWVVSYLARSGHTLTVVLNLDDGSAVGFASSEKSWEVARGTFAMNA